MNKELDRMKWEAQEQALGISRVLKQDIRNYYGEFNLLSERSIDTYVKGFGRWSASVIERAYLAGRESAERERAVENGKAEIDRYE